MNNEEKILAILEAHSKMFEKMQEDISGLNAGQSEMRADMRAMQEDISGLNAGLSEMQADMGEMQKTLTRVALTQENIVLKGLDALAEGQDLTHHRLKDLAGKDELAELRDEVLLLRTVVTQHTRDIEALKAAQ